MFVSITGRQKKAPNNGTDRKYQPEVTQEIGGTREGQFNASPFFKRDLSAVAALIG